MATHTSLRCCTGVGARQLDERESWLRATIAGNGWAVIAVDAEYAHAFTVGLWHSYGLAELAMFGLATADMQVWLNSAVAAVRERADLGAGEPFDGAPFDGVLGGFPVLLQEIHVSWHRPLFDAMCAYYGAFDVPVRQVVWPDRDGHWPWEPDATDACRRNQPTSWLPVDEHPEGGWRLVAELSSGWPFTALQPDSTVGASRSVVAGREPIAAVARDSHGGWDFLDARGHADGSTERVHFGHLYREQPWLVRFADLPMDMQARLDSDGQWRVRGPDR